MRLVGGEFLLNLTGISLGLTAGEVSISDAEVLSQLLELRNFIDEKRDFTKGFKDLKPVLVQYRSSASKIDGVVPCNLSFNTDALHLSIAGYSVQADGTPITLRINVVYEWTDYVGYTIKTAKLESTNEFHGALAFEDIVDKDGHKRFIDIDGVPTPNTDYEITYCKASLSGSHLLLVVAGKVKNGATISNVNLAVYTLPKWIQDKIVGTFGKYIATQVVTGADENWNSSQQFSVYLSKEEDGTLRIIPYSTPTMTADRFWRIQFDLLIDNEESE